MKIRIRTTNITQTKETYNNIIFLPVSIAHNKLRINIKIQNNKSLRVPDESPKLVYR